MSQENNFNIVGRRDARFLRRYQLSWTPAFYSAGSSSVYILGEDVKFSSGSTGAAGSSSESSAGARSVGSLQDIINLGVSNGLVLPLNTNIALAQEYSPSIKNKVVTYETVGGNSITTFGEAIKTIGLRIRIIRLSDAWQIYYKGLEAISYLSGNQSRYYGGLYLTGFDSFGSDVRSLAVSYRYKVTIGSLDFNFKSDSTTTVTADLKMFVNQDLTRSRQIWGQL
jgi:hypothetical protein